MNVLKSGLVVGFILFGLSAVIFSIKYTKEQEAPTVIQVEKIEQATSTVMINEQVDLPLIIKQWHPAVAKINCYFKESEDKVYLQTGSGFFSGHTDDTLKVFTNRHVLRDEENTELAPDICEVSLPESSESFLTKNATGTTSDIYQSTTTLDWGYVHISYPTKGFSSTVSKNLLICDTKQNLGTPVVILGYPGVGSKNGITVTQGIISGYDDDYYITDAKIGQGNSGGVAVAIDTKKDTSCYLGMPTYAEVGEVISLGRILDVRSMPIKY